MASTPQPSTARSDLKIIANVAVGYDNLDVAHARSRGIVCTNTPDVLTDAVADYTWALILAITRRLGEGERIVRRGEWNGWAFDFMLGTSLRGQAARHRRRRPHRRRGGEARAGLRHARGRLQPPAGGLAGRRVDVVRPACSRPRTS